MVDYSGVKPKTCPKCNQPFSAAFTVPVTAIPDSAPKESRAKSVAPKKKSRILAGAKFMGKEEPATPSKSTFMNPQDIPQDQDSDTPEDQWNDDTEDEEVAPDEVATYAEELKASLNEEDIQVQFADQPVRFQWHGPKAKS